MYMAAQDGHDEVVSKLIELGADVDLRDDEGTSPLWIASAAGHDLAVEALVGLLSNNVDRDGRPGLPAMPAGDMLAAAYAVAGIAMALYRREQTGRGDYLDLAMMDSILFSMSLHVNRGLFHARLEQVYSWEACKLEICPTKFITVNVRLHNQQVWMR